MSSNSAEFDSRFFTQTDGATIGSLDSGSVTDIFRAIYIDNVIEEKCPVKPENYVRYRDYIFDVCSNSTGEEQKEVRTWMDNNIYKDKIKFEMKCSRNEIMFLDNKILLRSEKDSEDESKVCLVPRMYPKATDTHLYLHPTPCHSPHITKILPSCHQQN